VRPADLAAIARIRAALADGSARRTREASGISAAEFAAALGVARQSVSAWESGRSVPAAAHALAYAKALTAVTRLAA
jgi:DNA-binding transcriptional regulator YiaG